VIDIAIFGAVIGAVLLIIGILIFRLHLKEETIFFETLQKIEKGEIPARFVSSYPSILYLKIAWIFSTCGVFLLSISIISISRVI